MENLNRTLENGFMTNKDISSGVVHSIPTDLRNILSADKDMLALWEDITPLARNEWICWVEDAKKTETRRKRIERVRTELKEGKRRPCCWSGCSHR